MRQAKRMILGVVFALALAFVVAGTDGIDYFRYWASGAGEARRDIERGHLELRGYGLPARCTPDYVRLLKDRAGVSYVPVAGCSVSRPLRRHTDEYNEVMTREIERRFGAGIVERLFDEASTRDAGTRPAG